MTAIKINELLPIFKLASPLLWTHLKIQDIFCERSIMPFTHRLYEIKLLNQNPQIWSWEKVPLGMHEKILFRNGVLY